MSLLLPHEEYLGYRDGSSETTPGSQFDLWEKQSKLSSIPEVKKFCTKYVRFPKKRTYNKAVSGVLPVSRTKKTEARRSELIEVVNEVSHDKENKQSSFQRDYANANNHSMSEKVSSGIKVFRTNYERITTKARLDKKVKVKTSKVTTFSQLHPPLSERMTERNLKLNFPTKRRRESNESIRRVH
mmetsp:Transcript_13263/g.16091  ORF Transcript_13263/g.16091 Transcript_13263/m.16091 type:complete len:185 (+) Transcript_13263:95-649(+)